MPQNIAKVALPWLVFLFTFNAVAQKVGTDSEEILEEVKEAKDSDKDSRFFAEDGDFDVSGFLDETYGFLPVAMPITEPAVGYGLGIGLAFISEPLGGNSEAGFGRPNITMVGGMGTENGTEGAMVADIRYWFDDRVQTLAGIGDLSVNLDFYGFGENEILAEHPLRYNLEPQLGFLQMKYRLSQSPFWLGLGYIYTDIDVTFEAPPTDANIPAFERNSVIAGALPSFTYDTRDNIFTPISGNYIELNGGVFGPSFGGDHEFQRARLLAMHFSRLAPEWFFGARFDAVKAYNDPPFFLKPYISLRGAPAMRYQGDQTVQVEAELRWQFTDRFSAVAFAGTGQSQSDLNENLANVLDEKKSIVTGGVGFRYEIARKYGIHMGLDIAASEDDQAIYVQVGSAWARP